VCVCVRVCVCVCACVCVCVCVCVWVSPGIGVLLRTLVSAAKLPLVAFSPIQVPPAVRDITH